MNLCSNCVHFRRNKPNTPIFIKGLWWGGEGAGICERKPNPHTFAMGGHVVDSDGCELWESDKPEVITFKGVNCPACGRFMRKDPELQEWNIEHSHGELTHTHPIYTELWLCVCGGREQVEVAVAHHVTFELPEKF